jgi:hypothetical protein
MQTSAAYVIVAVILTASASVPIDTCTSQKKACPPDASLPDVAFEARVITAGPYGEMWTVKLDRDTKASVEINWMLNPMGDLKGSFLIDPSDLARIAAAADTASFATLPKEITPAQGVPLHAPDLRLRLTSKGKTHSVRLYDPAEVEDRAKVDRFMTVWNAIFKVLHPIPGNAARILRKK